jgi:hypothetical protein
MTLEQPIPLSKPKSFRQWLAELLQEWSERLTGQSTIQEPSIDDIRATLLRDAQLALLNAKAEKERYCHTVAMLEERIGRLHHGDEGNPPARTSPSART